MAATKITPWLGVTAIAILFTATIAATAGRSSVDGGNDVQTWFEQRLGRPVTFDVNQTSYLLTIRSEEEGPSWPISKDGRAWKIQAAHSHHLELVMVNTDGSPRKWPEPTFVPYNLTVVRDRFGVAGD